MIRKWTYDQFLEKYGIEEVENQSKEQAQEEHCDVDAVVLRVFLISRQGDEHSKVIFNATHHVSFCAHALLLLDIVFGLRILLIEQEHKVIGSFIPPVLRFQIQHYGNESCEEGKCRMETAQRYVNAKEK